MFLLQASQLAALRNQEPLNVFDDDVTHALISTIFFGTLSTKPEIFRGENQSIRWAQYTTGT